jgi:branched-chain amino acid transport system ATP-binding protein
VTHAPTTEPLLEVKSLHVQYGAIKSLHGVNLRVMPGQIVTLIGCNGAGKTSTLRAISGLVKPSQGEVILDGSPITGLAPHQIVRRGLAHAPEGRGIFANLTVSENLDLGAFARSDHAQIAADRERALTLFPRVRERLSQMAGTLSGGEQQMLAIARALMARPKLLLLDEPSLGLAPQIVQRIFQIIREINAEGTTILLVEQNAHMALKVAHYAYVLEVGAIVMENQAAILAASDAVRKAYLGVA